MVCLSAFVTSKMPRVSWRGQAAVTGDVNLMGELLPSHGLSDKVGGAYNAGVSTIFLSSRSCSRGANGSPQLREDGQDVHVEQGMAEGLEVVGVPNVFDMLQVAARGEYRQPRWGLKGGWTWQEGWWVDCFRCHGYTYFDRSFATAHCTSER